MSSDVANVFVGTVANDGTGDPIRTAFQQVNNNFANIDNRISTGNYGIVYSGTFVQANIGITSLGFTNTQLLHVYGMADISGNANIANLNVNNSFVTSTMTATNNVTFNSNLNVVGPASFANNVVVVGNLTVLGNTTSISSSDLAVQDSIINLHTFANLAPLTVDDGKDIGIQFHYYKGADKHAALVWANDTQALEFYANGVESGANTFTGTYGNVKIGSLFTANTGESIIALGNVSAPEFNGNLHGTKAWLANITVSGTVDGNLYLNGSDTVYINGSPVSTAAQSFAGGTVPNYTLFNNVVETRGNLFANSNVQSTSSTTGALVVRGGVGVNGDFYMVGNAYVSGTVTLGTIQGTPIGGTSNSSGTFTDVVTSGTLKSAGNIVAYSGVESTNILTGALVVRGGVGVTGNLNVGGSINNTAIGVYGPATGDFSAIGSNSPGQGFFTTLKASANLVAYSGAASSNTTTGALVVVGGVGVSGNVNIGANLTAVNSFITSETVTTLRATNFSTGNAVINGTSVGAFATLQATNFSSGNVQISGGNAVFTTLNATNISSTNVQVTGTAGINSIDSTNGASSIKAIRAANGNQDISMFANISSGSYNALNTSGDSAIVATGSTIGNAALSISTWSGAASGIRIATASNVTTITMAASSVIPSGNATTNLGSATNWWNTIYGVASQAKYADLAESYLAPQPYGPGTVLIFGGDFEVDVTNEFADTRVAGAVSTNPAYLMNADLYQGISVALRGRVPVNVLGKVQKGDLLVTANIAGYATSVGRDNSYGAAVFAKSLNNKDDDGPGVVEAVIL